MSKKLRVWERQLMKDFHVGLIVKDKPSTESFSEDESITDTAEKDSCTSSRNNKTNKFRNIVRKAAFNSPTNKWKRTINEVYKA